MKTLLFLWRYRKVAKECIELIRKIHLAVADHHIDAKERDELQREFWDIVDAAKRA